jgi:hypothetical protein
MTDRAQQLPATDKQLDYLCALRDQLNELFDDGGAIVADIDTVIESSKTSKRDAHKLIDSLLDTLADLRGEPRRQKRTRTNVVAINPEVDEYRVRQKKLADEFRVRADAFAAEQKRQFGNAYEREAPEGRGHTLKVWKKHPNDLMQGDHYGWHIQNDPWNGSINYGWVWECYHESHTRRKGPDTVTGRSHKLGFRGAVLGAQRHWLKFHYPAG